MLMIDVGADASGSVTTADLTKAPHLLIAGATGSGKSVMIHNIVAGLLEQQARLILIDLKMVELAPYNGLPQLLTPVIFEADQAARALKWAVHEMDRRYRLLLDAKVRDIDQYNDALIERLHLGIDRGDELLLPIVIVIDELADLMLSDAAIEEPIVRLAQKARAAGIHLVLATQRPSVDVVTGLIKANVPSRIAFTTASHIDSRTIIDTAGAEALNGRGDMLYKPPDQARPIRLQGVYVSPDHVAETIERYQVDNT